MTSVNNTNINKKKRKAVDFVNNIYNKNRTLIIGFSNCGKICPMNHILLQKQEPIFIKTKSLNQYPNIKAEISDVIQPLENYENNTVLFLTICCYQNKKALKICSLREDNTVILIYTTYLEAIFISKKNYSCYF